MFEEIFLDMGIILLKPIYEKIEIKRVWCVQNA